MASSKLRSEMEPKRIAQLSLTGGDRCIICNEPASPDLTPAARAVYRRQDGTLVRDNIFRRPRTSKEWKFFGWTHAHCWTWETKK